MMALIPLKDTQILTLKSFSSISAARVLIGTHVSPQIRPSARAWQPIQACIQQSFCFYVHNRSKMDAVLCRSTEFVSCSSYYIPVTKATACLPQLHMWCLVHLVNDPHRVDCLNTNINEWNERPGRNSKCVCDALKRKSQIPGTDNGKKKRNLLIFTFYFLWKLT